MSIDYSVENEGQLLTVRITGRLDLAVLNNIFGSLEGHVETGLRQILVLRQGAVAEYDFDSGVAFGQKIADLLASKGVVIAVVKTRDQIEDITIDSVIFNSGISIGQFNDEVEARNWLSLKAE